MEPRHKITKEYESNPRHIRRWELTLEWLMKFGVAGKNLDCGDRTNLTEMIECRIRRGIDSTKHDLDLIGSNAYTRTYDNIFVFEVIEHLLNPLLFLKGLHLVTNNVYLSTPINRPKWMRNKELHFHEFNYNELVYLIDVAGFKIVDEKRINCTTWKMITGFRPLLRFFGIDKNILLRLKRA